MKVLIITSEWPTNLEPNNVPFLTEQIKYIVKIGINIEVHKISSESFLQRIESIIRLRKKLKINKYDLLHTHWGYNGIYSIGSNLPHIITFHGSDLNKPNIWSFRLILIYFLSKISTLLSSYNIFVSKHLSEKSLSKNNKIVIPMGVNLKKFFPMNKLECRKLINLSLQKKIILFAGNSSKTVKRVALAKEAVELLDDNIELVTLDYVSHKLIPVFINACDLLLMTSISEGSPMMIKEALACNKPIVSTNVGDVHEMLHGLSNCYVIDDESPVNISELITKCFINDAVPNSRERVKKKYSLDKTTNDVVSLYKNLFEKKC